MVMETDLKIHAPKNLRAGKAPDRSVGVEGNVQSGKTAEGFRKAQECSRGCATQTGEPPPDRASMP